MVKYQDNHPLKLDNIERSNIKWVFVKFSNIEVKAVFDRQPHRALVSDQRSQEPNKTLCVP